MQDSNGEDTNKHHFSWAPISVQNQYMFLALPAFHPTPSQLCVHWMEGWTKAKSPDPDPVLGPQHDTGHNRKLKGGELKMVMDRLGVTYHSDGEMLEEGLVADELPQLFEEEPSLEEVKKAFDVFDENKDGFIEATELQRVLCSLGLKEGSQVEDCRRMIKAFDEDDDGQIDFKEFVKFLDKSFS